MEPAKGQVPCVHAGGKPKGARLPGDDRTRGDGKIGRIQKDG